MVGQEPVSDCEVTRIMIATRICGLDPPLPYNFRSQWSAGIGSIDPPSGPVAEEGGTMNVAELSATPGAPSAVQRVRPRHHPLLGGLLVKEGLINRAQLEKVLALQQEIEPRPLLGQILLDQKLITSHELNALLSKYQRKHLLGDVLIETNTITPAQLETALVTQRKTDGPLGDTLIQLGFITEQQLKQALSIQLRIAFVDLDDRSIDPSMTPVISERYARHHRAIPIAKIEDRIVLAMDDPTDVEVVAEVRSCTGHRIDVVTATADALERAFSRVYGERGDVRSVHPSRVEEDEAAGREAMEQMMPAAVSPEQDASAPDGGGTTHRRGGERARAGVAFDAIRARMDAIRQLARNWERWTDAVEALLRERLERRAEIERLAGELRESRTALARTSQELQAKAQVLTRLEMAHAAVLQEREALGRSLCELRERHDALLRDRQFAIDHVSAILRRLRP